MRKFLLFLALLFSCSLVLASAQSGGPLEDKQKEIEELEQKVTQLKQQAKTLASQIAYYDGQIQLTGLKISQTEELIATISSKIRILEDRLQSRSQVLEQQIVQTYKQGENEPLTLFFSSRNFSQLVSHFKYLQIIQVHNRKFLHDTQLVQSSYASQKDLLEQSHKKLEAQEVQLANLRSQKDNLLVQTKNSEEIYQKQLEQARLELQAIERALAAATKEGPVNAGDPIAIMGNSGYPDCSTGAHLHFEVRQNDQWVNAESYLKPITDKWGLTIGTGPWDWPMHGDIEITQRYGHTPYSYRYTYSGGIHTGIDMVSSEKVIYASKAGTLYSYTGKCGNSDLKIKYIDHGSGLKTFYLHVQ